MGRKSREKRMRQPRQWNTALQTPEEAKRMAAYTRAVALKQPRGMCATCAFRPGTEANTSSENLVSIEGCLAGIVGNFTCHAGGVMDENGFLIEGTGQGETCRGYAALRETLNDMAVWKLISPEMHGSENPSTP